MLRLAVIIAAAVSSGVALGRQQLSNHIEKQKQLGIAKAADRVRQEIKSSTQLYLRDGLSALYTNFIVKTSVLLSIWGAERLEWINTAFATFIMAAIMLAFIIWDSYRVWPRLKLVVSELYKHQWKPRIAIGEAIAANVFQRVLLEAQADLEQMDRYRKLLFRLAGNDQDKVTREIASAVSEIARKTTWSDLAPYLLVAGASAVSMSLLYTAFVWSIFRF